jgi:hypothetical protein
MRPNLGPTKPIFGDEIRTKTNMTRTMSGDLSGSLERPNSAGKGPINAPCRVLLWERRRCVQALGSAVLLFLASFRIALSAELWLGGFDPVMLSILRPGVASDYLELFAPNAPWTQAAAHVNVFQITGSLAGRGSETDLRRIFTDLQRRNIALALAVSALTTKGDCGQGIEAYGPPGGIARLAERIRRLGGNLRFIAMDEPLWYGHIFSGASACHTAIPDLVKEVATTVSVIKHVFPEAQVGDIEGIGYVDPPDLVDQIMQFANAYQKAVGEPLAFLRTDILWSGPWRQQLSHLASRLHAAGIRLSIIYNGDLSDQTGVAWTRHAEKRFAEIEADPALIPEQAVVQTWMFQPGHMLPESQPGTMTWLVNRYIAMEAHIDLSRVGNRLEGQLTDSAGRPLAHQSIAIAAQQTGRTGAPSVHLRSGYVPTNAVRALFALRINTECGCAGQANVAIGPMQYREDSTGRIVQLTFRPVPAPGDAGIAHFRALPDQSIMLNTPTFPVTADAPFTVRVPMITDLGSADSGYVSLNFQDAQGKGIERQPLAFRAAELSIGVVTTDADGQFSLTPNPDVLHSSVGFSAEFAGDSQYRTSSATSR